MKRTFVLLFFVRLKYKDDKYCLCLLKYQTQNIHDTYKHMYIQTSYVQMYILKVRGTLGAFHSAHLVQVTGITRYHLVQFGKNIVNFSH